MTEKQKNKIGKFRSIQYGLLDKAYIGQLKYTFTCISDISDKIKLANLLLREEYKEAARIYSDFDTSEREDIPDYIYNILDKYL